jgi:hypothetical protein
MASYFVSSASGAGGAGNGSSWANAYLTIAGAIAKPLAAGDILLVGDDHSENVATNIILNCTTATAAAPLSILCVDHTKASPTGADLKVGVNGAGSLVTTTTGNVQFAGFMYVYGLYCNTGTGGSAANNQGVFAPNASKIAYFEQCTFGIASTGTSCHCMTTNNNSSVEFRNCTFLSVNNSNGLINGLSIGAPSRVKFIGCTFSFSGTQPVPFIQMGTGSAAVFEGCDFSAYTGGTLVLVTSPACGDVFFKDCKLPSSPGFDMTGTLGNQETFIWVVNSDNGNTNYRNEFYDYGGNQTTSITVVRTGGASQGTAYSWKIATNANNNWMLPLKLPPISAWNTATGAAKNVTIEGIADPRYFSALPNNDDFWFDVEALTSASQPIGVTTVGTKNSPIATGSALTASTSAWDSAATARANSTAYNLGDIFKVSSSPGRLFLCTTAGTTASSQPGIPYTSAVDGVAVTDGTAVFTAMWRFKQTLTTGTIQFAGLISVYPKVGKASAGFYIDPLAVLS